jgi:integrase
MGESMKVEGLVYVEVALADAFAEWSTCSTLDRASLRAYGRVVKALARFGITHVGQLSRRSVCAFIDQRIADGLAIATVNHDVKSLQALLRWLERRVDVPPVFLTQFSRLRIRERRSGPPSYWTEDQASRLLPEAYAIAAWFGLALELAIWTGARRTELRHELREDYDLLARVLRLTHHTKFQKTRVVSLCQPVVDAILAHAPPAGPLFPALSPRARTAFISDDMFKWAMAELGRRTGIPCTWHKARRTFTTWAIQRGVPVPDIARFLGHEDLRVLYRHYYCWLEVYSPSIEKLASTAAA